MPYETYMGTFIDENDHNLQRKFGYKYRALKGIYPDAYKLPETEVSKAIDVFYDGDADEGVEKMTDRVRNYTTAKDQEWKAKYFGEAPKPKPQESYSSVTIKAPSGFAQRGNRLNHNQNTLNKISNNIKLAKDIVYDTSESFGEFVADVVIAKEYYDTMKQTGKRLVNKYGSGAASTIDDYYHPLLQCQLSKISPTSRYYGLSLGYDKEIYDYHKKKSIMSKSDLITDMKKDLNNNLLGSNLGYYNQNVSCLDLLDDFRTENMRKENIR